MTGSDQATPGPIDGRVRICRVAVGVGLGMLAYFAALPFDGPVYHAFKSIDTGETDWHRLLRVLGYLPLWLTVAVVFALHDSKRRRELGGVEAFARVGLMLMSTVIAALLAEGMKIVARRERPNLHDGEAFYRPFGGLFDELTWRSSGLGMPSSHTAVAFAALGMLCYLFPRASVVWLALAAGCAATRCINHSHFVSDAAVAAVIGLLTARAAWHDHLIRHRLDPHDLRDRPFA